MRKLLFAFSLVGAALVGCSDDKDEPTDAAVAQLSCDTYCSSIMANCTGDNIQYPDMAHCLGTCAKFPKGTVSDMTGNTLGCRTYHAGTPSMTTPAMHCPHAGPGGAAIGTTVASQCGNPCESFCALEVATCGTLDAPITGAPAQYQNLAACMTACGDGTTGFAKANLYIGKAPPNAPAGDSLACRLYHITNAAVSTAATTPHCSHTAASQATGSPCAGTPAP
jgi:hypothetical protein